MSFFVATIRRAEILKMDFFCVLINISSCHLFYLCIFMTFCTLLTLFFFTLWYSLSPIKIDCQGSKYADSASLDKGDEDVSILASVICILNRCIIYITYLYLCYSWLASNTIIVIRVLAMSCFFYKAMYKRLLFS